MMWPTCVRHSAPAKDTKFRYYFLCDDCCAKWTAEAFSGNAPLHSAESVDGYCLLCNQVNAVRMRTWFLCEVCNRVAASIGRNHVAELAIEAFWKENVQTRLPHLVLTRNDIAALRPRRRTDESATAPIDFLARDILVTVDLFGIENKTGRSSLTEMSQFQLDCSDCDTIINDMRRLNVPAYIIHAQVLEVWDRPPTVGFKANGLWWTDVYQMAEHFKKVQQRGDENRNAAYFGKKAFHDISTFPDAVEGKSGETLVERFKREGIPKMYRLPEKAG